MSPRLCARCGAPLKSENGEAPVCKFCGAEEQTAPAPSPVLLEAARGHARIMQIAILSACVTIAIGIAVAMLVTREPPPPPAPVSVVPIAPVAPPAPVVAAVPAVPPAPTKIAVTVDLTLTKKGPAAGAFDRAMYVTVDDRGHGWVVDHSGRVQEFDPAGALVSSFRAETTNQPHGPASEDITMAQGLAADHKGRVWISMGYDLVAYDTKDGKQVLKTPHQYPKTCFRDITVDQTGQLIVVSACTDPNKYAIVRTDPDGRVLATYPESNDWVKDTSDRIAIDAAGQLYEPHSYEGQIVVVDSHAKVVTRFGGPGDALGYFRRGGAPRGLVIDAKGRLFVTNSDDIDVYDLQGHAKGRLERHWAGAKDLAIGPDGRLWVVDNGGVQVVTVGE